MTERPTDERIGMWRDHAGCCEMVDEMLDALEMERERADGERQERSIAADWASHHAARADAAEARVAAVWAILPPGTVIAGGKATPEQRAYLEGQQAVWKQIYDAFKATR